MKQINKYGIILRLVEEKDAEFILTLRTNTLLSRHISHTSDKLTDQIKWIQNYKIRELSGHEYYFITEDLEGQRYGTIRLYNFNEKSFEIGSWIFNNNSPLGMAVKTQFIGFEMGFEVLKKDYCKFEIRKANKAVLRYIDDFKTTLINEDELNFYYVLTKENFLTKQKKISFLLNSNI